MMACLACGHAGFRALLTATDRLYGTTPREFRIVACEGCGLMRLAPLPTPEDLARYYPAHYWYAPDGSFAAGLEERYRRLVLRDHVRFVGRALAACGESGPVLDVGCGGGLFPRLLRERGFAAIGLDSSPEAAALAWHTNGVPVFCGDLAQSPLGAGVCAGITMFHVLEHVYDPRAYLAAARVLLKPHGRLIVQVPAGSSACWAPAGTEWMRPATLPTSAPATWKPCWPPPASKCCAASISPCAITPQAWPPALRLRSTPWRAGCAVYRKRRRPGCSKTWRISC